jgi:hypothetical protein
VLRVEGSNVSLTIDGSTTSRSIASVTAISITGAPDVDDTLAVDLSGGPVLVPISFDGGTAGYDSLVVTGSNEDFSSTATSRDSGSVSIGGTTITYTGLEPVTNTGTAANVILAATGGSDTLNLTSDGSGNLVFSGDTIESTSFADTASTVTLNLGGGSDTITITSLGTFTGDLTIHGGTGVDTFVIHGLGSYAGSISITGGGGGDIFKLGNAFGDVTITDSSTADTLDFTARNLVTKPLTVDGSKNFTSTDGSALTQSGADPAGSIDVDLLSGISGEIETLADKIASLEQSAENAVTELQNAIPFLPQSATDTLASLIGFAQKIESWSTKVATALTSQTKLSALVSALQGIPSPPFGVNYTTDYRGAAVGGHLEVLLNVGIPTTANAQFIPLDFGSEAEKYGISVDANLTATTRYGGRLGLGATTDALANTVFLDPGSNLELSVTVQNASISATLHQSWL